MNCPYCGHDCTDSAEFVNELQLVPYHCTNCGAVEIDHLDEPKPLTAREKETGWYEPTSGEHPWP